jgi:hypothetical protein
MHIALDWLKPLRLIHIFHEGYLDLDVSQCYIIRFLSHFYCCIRIKATHLILQQCSVNVLINVNSCVSLLLCISNTEYAWQKWYSWQTETNVKFFDDDIGALFSVNTVIVWWVHKNGFLEDSGIDMIVVQDFSWLKSFPVLGLLERSRIGYELMSKCQGLLRPLKNTPGESH